MSITYNKRQENTYNTMFVNAQNATSNPFRVFVTIIEYTYYLDIPQQIEVAIGSYEVPISLRMTTYWSAREWQF